MTKERSQNPAVGDTVRLRLFTYNNQQPKDVYNVVSVGLYFLDPAEVSDANPDGRRLIQTVDSVDHDDEGQYSITVDLEDAFVIGRYVDVWELQIVEDQSSSTVEQRWQVIPSLWFTSPEPMIYDFMFGFRPNRLRAGSKQYLKVTVQPNLPSGSDLEKYYLNLALSAPLLISIEASCGDCLPAEADLRLIVDKASVDIRKNCEAYYLLDTEALELDCGIYNIWFQLDLGESRYISDKQQLEIYS